MIEPSTIARPYAEALFRIGEGEGSLGTWSTTLAALAQVVREPAIQAALSNPLVTSSQAAGLLSDILGSNLDQPGRNLVTVLSENHRLSMLPEIATQFEELKASKENVVEAEIATALPLSEDQLRDLQAALEKRTGSSVRTSVVVEPDLIGGVRVVIGDKVIDASVRAQLAQLSNALKA